MNEAEFPSYTQGQMKNGICFSKLKKAHKKQQGEPNMIPVQNDRQEVNPFAPSMKI